MTVEDLTGEPVEVGDMIAYAATDGRSGGIRVGTVLKIIPERVTTDADKYWGAGHTVPTKLQVEVSHSSGYCKPGKPTLIDTTLKRFVKVGP